MIIDIGMCVCLCVCVLSGFCLFCLLDICNVKICYYNNNQMNTINGIIHNIIVNRSKKKFLN